MHLYYFLQCHYPGWLLIKTFLELESESLLLRWEDMETLYLEIFED